MIFYLPDGRKVEVPEPTGNEQDVSLSDALYVIAMQQMDMDTLKEQIALLQQEIASLKGGDAS